MQGEVVNTVDNFSIKTGNNLKPEFIAKAGWILTVKKTQEKFIKYFVERGCSLYKATCNLMPNLKIALDLLLTIRLMSM